jgi:hypothetical protein
MRKGYLIIIALVVCTGTAAHAGTFEVTPFVGYMGGGGVSTREGDLDIENGANFGVAFDYTVDDQIQIEFLYSHQPTRLEVRPFGSEEPGEVYDMAMEYYQGGVLFRAPEAPLQLYGGFAMGAARMAPDSSELNDEWMFALSLAGGIKALEERRVGVRVEGRLYLPYLNPARGLFCGDDGSCVTGIPGTLMVQGNVMAGLIIAF